MPYSSGLCKGEIRDWLRAMRPATILDVGAGSGTYSRLFRPVLPLTTWVAVEVHEPYVARFELKQHYDQVIVDDARNLRIGSAAFDAVLLGDVLEHLEADAAAELLASALDWSAKGVVVSIPLGDCPQGPSEDNAHEEHVTSWTYSEFMNFVHDHGMPKADGALVRQDSDYRIGAFLWLK